MSDVWRSVLSGVEQAIPPEQFSTWFSGTELISVENQVATIGVPNVFKIKQLEVKYSGVLHEAFRQNNLELTDIKYIVQTSSKPKIKPRDLPPPVVPHSTAINTSNEAWSPNGSSTFQTGLNSRYSLDNFVIGSNNDLAVSVARNVVDKPGAEKYNPFFLYGGPGLGKTHLVQAIGNEILRKNPKLKVHYTSTSSFYSDFIRSIQNKKGDEFHQKFRQLDVLIIDDFQMIVGKEASQVEFFDIFNELHGLNKQIIITSDRLPSQIKTVDERLASRLTMTGAFDLQLPQFEDKCAILRAKADFMGVQIEDEAIEYLAENVRTNIRDLEGEFSRLITVADLKGMTPLAIINEGYVNPARSPQSKSISSKQIVEKVAKYYQLTPKEMCSKSRVSHIKNARQVAMYMLSKELGMSTPKIAMEVGVKDHTTVMHGIKKIESDLKLNFSLRDDLAALREKIYG